MRGARLEQSQPLLCWTQQSQKIFKQQEPLHLHKTLLYLYHDKLEALKCSELEIVLTYSWMFTYNWYQDARPTYCISNLYFLKILHQAGHSVPVLLILFALKRLLRHHRQTTLCSPQPVSPGQRPEAKEAEAISTFRLHFPQPRRTQV